MTTLNIFRPLLLLPLLLLLLQDGAEARSTEKESGGQTEVCDSGITCLNGGRCEAEACDCSETNYEGNTCQFAKHLSSCGEYLRHGYNDSGYYLVDVDEGGPLEPVVVWCESDNNKTMTVVAHNLPTKYAARNTGWPNYRLPISYGKVRHKHLVRLTASKQCKQTITFDCTRASLLLSNQTWFSRSHSRRVNQTECQCKENKTCDEVNVNCNCDIVDSIRRKDVIVITDSSQLPVTEASFLGNNSAAGTELLMTLSKLTCEEEALENIVTLSESTSLLKLTNSWTTMSSLSFAFRTTQRQGKLVDAPYSRGNRAAFRVVLADIDVIQFIYAEQSSAVSHVFRTVYLLNTGEWQHIRVDFSHQQVRLTVNGDKKFFNISYTADVNILLFGGMGRYSLYTALRQYDYPGIIGCLRDIRVNNKAVWPPAEGSAVALGCPCDLTPCQYDGKCHSDHYSGRYICECGELYEGDHCEEAIDQKAINLVRNSSEVTVLVKDRSRAHTNPIINDLSFNFRTRQSEAFLFFAYDNYQNLLQIWLSKPYEIGIIFNSNHTLIHMALDTGNIALNTGQSVEFRLQRIGQTITATVTVGGTTVLAYHHGKRQLITEYSAYPYESQDDTKYLPSYPMGLTLSAYFYEVYIGGARTHFRPSSIKSLIGCFSNYTVGYWAVNIQDNELWKRTGSVQSGCQLSCHISQSCHNSGKCLNVFGRDQTSASCDCDGTGYEGDYCDEEIAYVIADEDALSFAFNENLELKSYFSVEFAFVLNISSAMKQTLLALRDTNTRQSYGIEVSRDSSLLIRASGSQEYNANRIAVLNPWQLGEYITPGRRYSVKVTFSQDTVAVEFNGRQIAVPLDADHNSTDYFEGEHLSKNLIISGANRQGMTGCISNVRITAKYSGLVTRPLHYFNQKRYLIVEKEASNGNTPFMLGRVYVQGAPTQEACSTDREFTSKTNKKNVQITDEDTTIEEPVKHSIKTTTGPTTAPNTASTTTASISYKVFMVINSMLYINLTGYTVHFCYIINAKKIRWLTIHLLLDIVFLTCWATILAMFKQTVFDTVVISVNCICCSMNIILLVFVKVHYKINMIRWNHVTHLLQGNMNGNRN